MSVAVLSAKHALNLKSLDDARFQIIIVPKKYTHPTLPAASKKAVSFAPQAIIMTTSPATVITADSARETQSGPALILLSIDAPIRTPARHIRMIIPAAIAVGCTLSASSTYEVSANWLNISPSPIRPCIISG